MLIKAADCLESDSRFKRWCKLIRSAADVDLSKKGGYALTAPFCKWSDTVAIGAGQFLVCSAETGSRAHHGYSYALVDETGKDIDIEGHVTNTVKAGFNDGLISETQLADALNSRLYLYAVFIYLQSVKPKQPQTEYVLAPDMPVTTKTKQQDGECALLEINRHALVQYDGMYYGDLSVFSANDDGTLPDGLVATTFEPKKAGR